MKLVIGKYSGFCAGVNNTYTKAKEILKNGKVYCLGEIIHNEHVISELENLGMITVHNIEDIPDNSKCIFRAHGESLEHYEFAKHHHIEVIDLTCPNVKRIHNKVINNKDNKYIILIGKKNHPEVIGTISYAPNNSIVIENEDDINNLDIKLDNIYIVCQTTFSIELFNKLVNIIKNKYQNKNIIVDNTICMATSKRQEEAQEISKSCDKVLVLGSKSSSNTKELYNISIENNKETYFIENKSDLDSIHFNDKDSVGTIAGASVSKSFIEEIVSNISL